MIMSYLSDEFCSEYLSETIYSINKNTNLGMPYSATLMEGTLKNLTPEEKSFICSSHRKKLSKQAVKAISEGKIFKIYGNCEVLRRALIERGWIEKLPYVNVKRLYFANELEFGNAKTLILSKLVKDAEPNFVYNAIENFNYKKYHQNPKITYNRFFVKAPWTQKQALCAFRRNNINCVKDVIEVSTPRAYTSCNANEKDEFIWNYKLTACTGLLKWVLSRVEKQTSIFTETGNVSIGILVFAINRCKEYLYRKQHKNVANFTFPTISSKEWKTYLKYYHILIDKKDLFESDGKDKFPLYLDVIRILIQEIQKYQPQLKCEGYRNIWIIKPLCHSTSQGIKMESKLEELCKLFKKPKYIFQKYIEKPMLIYRTKFSIRQFFLITNTSPLEIWMYEDCYLTFSSQEYSLHSFHESIHFSNYEVQRHCKNSISFHPDLPYNKMWSSDTFKEYLQENCKEDAWDTIIYPGMKKAIVGVMLNFRDSLPYAKNRFELFGCEFILDKDYKPWLIEINSCPNLESTTSVTADICFDVLSDMVKVVIDRAKDYYAETGRFECIYGQKKNYLYSFAQGSRLQTENETKESKIDMFMEKEPNINTLINLLKIKHHSNKLLSMKSKDNICSRKASLVIASNITASRILDAVFAKDPKQKTSSTPKYTRKLKKELDVPNFSYVPDVPQKTEVTAHGLNAQANPQSDEALPVSRNSTRNNISRIVLDLRKSSINKTPCTNKTDHVSNVAVQATVGLCRTNNVTNDCIMPVYVPCTIPYAQSSIMDDQMQYINRNNQMLNAEQGRTSLPHMNVASECRVPVQVYYNVHNPQPSIINSQMPYINNTSHVQNEVYLTRASFPNNFARNYPEHFQDCHTNPYGQVFVVGGQNYYTNDTNQRANIEVQTKRAISHHTNMAKERISSVQVSYDMPKEKSFVIDGLKPCIKKTGCMSNVCIQARPLSRTNNVACEFKQPVQVPYSVSYAQPVQDSPLAYIEPRRTLPRTSNVACGCNVPVQVPPSVIYTQSSVIIGRPLTTNRADRRSNVIINARRTCCRTNDVASEYIESVQVSHTIPYVPNSVMNGQISTINKTQRRSNYTIQARKYRPQTCDEACECIEPVVISPTIPHVSTSVMDGPIPTIDKNNRRSNFTIQPRRTFSQTNDVASDCIQPVQVSRTVHNVPSSPIMEGRMQYPKKQKSNIVIRSRHLLHQTIDETSECIEPVQAHTVREDTRDANKTNQNLGSTRA